MIGMGESLLHMDFIACQNIYSYLSLFSLATFGGQVQ